MCLEDLLSSPAILSSVWHQSTCPSSGLFPSFSQVENDKGLVLLPVSVFHHLGLWPGKFETSIGQVHLASRVNLLSPQAPGLRLGEADSSEDLPGTVTGRMNGGG
jgi:hypothetical protein